MSDVTYYDLNPYLRELLDNHSKSIKSVSNPNLLINGDFQVWQRGTSITTTSTNTYTADRWSVRDANMIINKTDYGLKITNNRDESNCEWIKQVRGPHKGYLGTKVTLSLKYRCNRNTLPIRVALGGSVNHTIPTSTDWMISTFSFTSELEYPIVTFITDNGLVKGDWIEFDYVKLELG